MATPDALLAAAEVEFAERGMDGASLRAIMRAADANTAAIHYHFGSRDALVLAVLDRILSPINRHRVEALNELLSSDSPPDLAAVVRALILPDLQAAAELRGRNPRAARLLGTIYAQPNVFAKEHIEHQFGQVAEAFMPPLVDLLPHLTQAEIAWRTRWCIFGMLAGVLSADTDDVARDLRDVGAVADRLSRFMASGLMAETR